MVDINKETQNLEKPVEPPVRNRAVPRFIGIIVGLVSGFITGKLLRDMSLKDWIQKRAATGDSFITAAWKEVSVDLKAGTGGMQPAQAWLQTQKTELEKIKDGAIKTAQAIAKNNPAKGTRELNIAHNNFTYFLKQAENKIVNNEIMKRMGLGLRHSEHKKWIFVSSAVALGVIGYATYKVADYVVNHKRDRDYQQRLLEQRAAAEHTPPAPGAAM